MRFSVHSPDELTAALPHLLGFKPEESVVFVPMTADLPIARIDLPTTPRDRDAAWEAIRSPLGRYAQPGASVGIVCVTANREEADRVVQDFAARLDTIGIDTALMLWANDSEWHDYHLGESGHQTEAARGYVAAEMAPTGRPRPAASRASLASSLVGDREPVAELLSEAREAAETTTLRAEAKWAVGRLRQFHADSQPLSDLDAARLLVAVETIPIRDRLWDDMNTDNADSHVALWTNLTRRAPDQVRSAPASLLGLASWLSGDGAKALCAVEQVPRNSRYPLAGLVVAVVESAMHPREWESVKRIGQDADFAAPQPGPRNNPIRPAPAL
ncbi:hypothetical protein CFI00_17775 [Nocardioides sp. S5]|uniref:DUF4192 domain-containing protein n=1 Tax=Nocardioides sp. S5 TaxID=2017486 RepID=UPI001AFCAF49|nr:DUF4192 domain-containing protein [Nocardioides sp. S5]QSR32303.1 hypothetical protein CFI00_17775 [Nocardioides sp. S5]